jgi:nuclear pore complex protein Nup107
MEGDAEREMSADPETSFQDGGSDFDYDAIGLHQQRLLGYVGEHEDILHPLRETANRVGREVERFAEVLDGFNPLKATSFEEKRDLTLDLIDSYYEIALQSIEDVQAQIAETERLGGATSTQDGDIDMDAEDEQNSTALVRADSEVEGEGGLKDQLSRWKQEARTWDLLRRMTTLKYDPPSPPADAPQIHQYSPEKDVWQSFLHNDPVGLERNTIVNWLKETADEDGEDINVLVEDLQQAADRGDITAHGWLHTSSAIKNQKRLHAWPYVLDHTSPDVQRVHLASDRTEPLVTQLDPDAPTRQKLKLEAQDEYFERSIWRGCYELLRRGKSPSYIKDWCYERTEIWRAALMAGLPDDGLEPQNTSGTFKAKALWRRMCGSMAINTELDDYTRAVYGILAGEPDSILNVSKSWDDYMFAHYHSLLRNQYEKYVFEKFPTQRPGNATMSIKPLDVEKFLGDPKTVPSRLMKLLLAKTDLPVQEDKEQKVIQTMILSNTFEGFIYQQGLAISAEANAPDNSATALIANLHTSPKDEDIIPYVSVEDHDNLRVLTHMVIAYKALGMKIGGDNGDIHQYAIESIIVAYISMLRLCGKEELIPLYAAQLSEERCYATLSRTLIDVIDPGQRITMIKLMKELGLDVQRFVRMQMQFLFKDYPDEKPGYPASTQFKITYSEEKPTSPLGTLRTIKPDFIGDTIDTEEALMIRAFEWFLFVEGMWKETFKVGTALYKRFFKNVQLAACREIAARCSSRDIALQKTPVILGEPLEISDLLADAEAEPEAVEQLDGTTEITRLLKRHMAEEATPYVELEKLIEALDYVEVTSGVIDALQMNAVHESEPHSRQLRTQFHQNFYHCASISQLLQGEWLKQSIKSMSALTSSTIDMLTQPR